MYTFDDLNDLASEAARKIEAGNLKEGHELLEKIAAEYVNTASFNKVEISADAAEMLEELRRKLIIPDKPGLMHKKQCVKHAQAMADILSGNYTRVSIVKQPVQKKAEKVSEPEKEQVNTVIPETKKETVALNKPIEKPRVINTVKTEAPEPRGLELSKKAFNDAKNMMEGGNYVGAASGFRTVVDLLTQYLAIDKGDYRGKDDPSRRIAVLRKNNVISDAEADELHSFYSIGSIATHEYRLACSEKELRDRVKKLSVFLDSAKNREVPSLFFGEAVDDEKATANTLRFSKDEILKAKNYRNDQNDIEAARCLLNALVYAHEYAVCGLFRQPSFTNLHQGINYLYEHGFITRSTKDALHRIRMDGNNARHNEAVDFNNEFTFEQRTDALERLIKACETEKPENELSSNSSSGDHRSPSGSSAERRGLESARSTRSAYNTNSRQADAPVEHTDEVAFWFAVIIVIFVIVWLLFVL